MVYVLCLSGQLKAFRVKVTHALLSSRLERIMMIKAYRSNWFFNMNRIPKCENDKRQSRMFRFRLHSPCDKTALII